MLLQMTWTKSPRSCLAWNAIPGCLKIAMQISERWRNRRVLTEQINAFGKLPDPRDLSVQKLDSLNSKLAAQRERRDQILQQRRKVKQEAMDLPINRRLWAQKTRIEALAEHSPWVESLQRQVDKLKREIDSIDNSLLGEIDGLGNQLQIRTKDVRDLGNRGMSALKSSAKKLIEQQDRLKRIKDDVEKSEFDLGQQQDRLRKNVSNATGESPEDTNRYVNRLRRRVELEEKINKLQTSRLSLEREIDDVVNEQVLPVGKLGIIGVVFVAGIVMIGLGISNIFNSTTIGHNLSELGVLMMLMGAICGFISMGLKYHWERIARDELDDFRHQMEVLKQQLKRSISERDEIERQLPDSIGQWDIALKDAESKLARMEDLVPLENRYQTAQMSLEDQKRILSNQQHEVELADQQWRAALRTAGLPEALEPLQLKEISQRSQRIGVINVQLDQYRQELNDRNKELESLRYRIDELFQDSGLKFQSTDIMERLNELKSKLNEQRALVNQRKEFANQYKGLRSKLSKCKLEYDRLQGQKRRLLADVGADTEEQYRQMELKHNQRRKLLEKRNNLTEQIAAALGSQFIEGDVEEHLDAYGDMPVWKKRWEEIQLRIEETKEQQTRLHQQRGELLQEVKTLGEDSRLDEARLELNAVEAEIVQARRKWQALSTSAHNA